MGRKEDVPFRVTSELVKENGDAIDGTAGLEMSLDFFWRSAVIDVADEDAARINVFFALAHTTLAWAAVILHLTQLRSLSFHLLDTLLHRVDLIFVCGELRAMIIILMVVICMVRHDAVFGERSKGGEEIVGDVQFEFARLPTCRS